MSSAIAPAARALPVPVPLQVRAPSWRERLPVISRPDMTIRELQASDAASLFAFLTTEDVARLMSTPPATIDGFERFIDRSQRERAAGLSVCFGIVPRGDVAAVGLVQIRARDPRWDVVEWGFALGSPYWGTGLFMAAAQTTLRFAYDELGVTRVEARAALENHRGVGALRKLGAIHEGTLRGSLRLRHAFVDQGLWTLVDR